MLRALAIRDIVVFEKLDLIWQTGLSALTGETGAGKSILLDALGLALGRRAAGALVRPGAAQGSVSAEFELEPGHPAQILVAEQGLGDDDNLVLRRVLGRDGRSRAFVNDQPAGVALLKRIGDILVEVHGPAEEQGLVQVGRHRDLLDAFGGLARLRGAVAEAWAGHRAARDALAAARAEVARLQADEAFLRHALAELEALEPEAEEEAGLVETRTFLMNAERLAEAVETARRALADGAADQGLRVAEAALARVAGPAGGRFDPALAALERAVAEAGEAALTVAALARDLEIEPGRLAEVEERLFALRALARKHETDIAGLVGVRDRLGRRLARLDAGAGSLAELEQAAARAAADHDAAAGRLSKARSAAARRLAKVVGAELAPLKMAAARFSVAVEPLDGVGGPEGRDRVEFRVATVAGAAPGPLGRVASGGELSRLMLALKVALADTRGAPVLIFDEVDRGIGGATADAVGERLARLAAEVQVLVVTHSPQVAARASHHWRITKRQNGTTATRVAALDGPARREEIARMLAGAEVTGEARAAAERLLRGAGA